MIDVNEGVQPVGNVVPAVGLLDIAGPQHEDALGAQRSGEHRAVVRAFGIDDLRVMVAVAERDRAAGSRAVGALIGIGARAIEIHVADAHDLPDVDHHFRMPGQEQVQVGIAVDHLDGHAAEDAGVVQDMGHLRLQVGGQLVQRDGRIASSRTWRLLVPWVAALSAAPSVPAEPAVQTSTSSRSQATHGLGTRRAGRPDARPCDFANNDCMFPPAERSRQSSATGLPVWAAAGDVARRAFAYFPVPPHSRIGHIGPR